MALPNNTDYTIISNSELSTVLGYFSAEMNMSILDDILNDRIRNHSQVIANLPLSYETNIKLAIDSYPDINPELLEKRTQTYLAIIGRLCSYHNLICNLGETTDIYAVAYYLYDFLISSFQNNIIRFYYNFVLKEKAQIYESLNLGETRKNKDSSTIYSKRISNGFDNVLMSIHANLDSVIDLLAGYDITLADFIRTVYPPQVANFLNSILVDNGDFYKRYIIPIITGPDRALFITRIRLILQGELQPPSFELLTNGSSDDNDDDL